MSIFGSIVSRIFGTHPAAATPGTPAADLAAPASTMEAVDVHAMLAGLAANHGETLRWETSIVDLLKLLDIDSSLHARQELAKELHFAGDLEDSASMNVWLHKAVMQKLAENGGRVPAELHG
ncbi:DUF3597 domain-containing protein [Plastoroseomonas arctica]|uniref:DUF3597 domain-containing protein n=1 Tax=Plastoroseomonas arctica TaxID=1509237 RepID=A0AAF1KJZ9_9PROT|nr:DUF3597 domain-containing protein [Plastoroseomonas arctica]MBR0655139.1 DUF3597 domain-containing protein [Plastoroseomonas arctica]